ncbi:stalk domain-containing protein [Acetivibrio cellulolyticus]|uniref:stalk domain-containing protein n=1 Tax=Acetivibrio cellulolyticus TaxID=35830 RepID=UPI0001E2D92F|nr:stalk domain-containing protein [Acetivibrio cellulolyticus]
MKRLLSLSLAIIFALVFLNVPVFAKDTQKEICVFIDGVAVEFDVLPVNLNGRVLIPFRAIAEALNVEVGWDGLTKTVKASDADTSISLQIGNKTAYKNKEAISLDVPPTIINGRTLIPIRFFSEAFGCEVLWDAKTSSVLITSPKKAMEVIGFYALSNNWANLFGKSYPQTGIGNTDLVSELAVGWYGMDEKGNLIQDNKMGWKKPDGWEKALEAAKAYNLKTEMCIYMGDGDNSLTKLIENTESVSNAVYNIAAEASSYNGVNLDFEGLGLSQTGQDLERVKSNFNYLVKLLSERLKKEGLSLTLTLHAPNSSYKGYDYKTLGQLADKIIIMAHDYGVKPEPINLVIEAVEEAKKEVPAEKLYLAISAASENEESIKSKVGIAKRYGLKGISLWTIGLASDEMWNSLKQVIELRQVK